ncbi:MAG TPA: recombination mediator RecR [Chitinivibrionales bacterium]
MIKPLDDLVGALSRLPTIGKKSAWRLALHLLERPQEELDHLSRCIGSLKATVTLCKRCFNYGTGEVCDICNNPSRDSGLICIVEKPMDVFAFEKSGLYRGLYHVLGGVLSPLSGITAEKLRIAQLRDRLQKESIREIILGLGSSAEAETTSMYIARLFSNNQYKITRLARGVPAGIELEYVDQITLDHALHERTDISYK